MSFNIKLDIPIGMRIKTQKMNDSNLRAAHRLSIAFLVRSFPNRSETFISRKVEYLLSQGHDVHVFCDRYNRNVEHPNEWKKRIHRFPSRRHVPIAIFRYLKAICVGRVSVKALNVAIREMNQAGISWVGCIVRLSCLLSNRWDIVHAHFLNTLNGFTGLRHIVGCPIVGSAYGYDVTITPFSGNGLQDLRVATQQTSALTYSSDFLKKQLHSICDVGEQSERILFPEVPTAAFTPLVRKTCHDSLRLLSVGRLHWAKGYPSSLAALRRLLDEGLDVEYRIIGEGPQREEIEYTIRNLNLNQHVHLEGSLPNERVAELMSWADLFVLPSVREAFGVVLIESQASGLPIVATRVEGVPEATCELETALLVRSRSPEELASAIKNLASNHALYQRLSENGPAHAERFSCEKIGEQLVALYRSLLKNQILDNGENRD